MYDTQSQAIREAIKAQRSGMLADDPRSVYQTRAGTFGVVCQGFEPIGSKIVATVAKGRVYQDGIGGSPRHTLVGKA